MKIIFLSMLAATTLTTVLSPITSNLNEKQDFKIIENDNNHLNNGAKKIMSNDYNDFWGARDDLFVNLSGGGQCWENVFLYCEPSKLVHKANDNCYELSARLYICSEEWDVPTITYLGTANYTDSDWYYDDVTFNAEESAFDVVFRTHNPSAEGEMYIFYTYYHYEEPPAQNISSPLWTANAGMFDYLSGGEQAWGYVYLYAKPEKFTKFGNKNVYEMTADVQAPVQEWNRATVTYVGLENFTGAKFSVEKAIYDKDEGVFHITLHHRTPDVTGALYFFFTYYNYPEAPEEEWYEYVDIDGMVYKNNDQLQLTYGTFASKGVKDNYPKNAVNVTTDTFKITGKICKYSKWEKMINELESQDADWYKFTIKPGTLKLHIQFSAPNNGYQMTIYRFRCPTDVSPKPNELYYRFGVAYACDTYFEEVPGTYFIKVSAPDKRVTSDNYEINVSATQTNNYFPLYTRNMNYYNAVIWENDFLPDQIHNRWSNICFRLKKQMHNYTLDKTGYFDPVFYETGLTLEKCILDSVIYIWGHEQIEFLTRALQALQILIRQNQKQLIRYKQIRSDIVELVSGTIQLALTGVSVATGAGAENICLTTIDDASTLAGGYDAGKNVVTAILDLILGNVPEEIDQFTIKDSALSLLIGVCDGISGDPNGVVCIPVYGAFDRYDSWVDGCEYWAYRRTFVPYQRLYASVDDDTIRPTNKFKFDRITELQKVYKVENEVFVETKTYHGSIHTFTSTEELKQYINYDYIMNDNL